MICEWSAGYKLSLARRKGWKLANINVNYPDSIKRNAAGISIEVENMEAVFQHVHRKAELLYLISGNLTVQSQAGIWVVPPGRALWIPAGSVHSSLETGEIKARCIFFEPNFISYFPESCHLVFVHPLLREIINRLTALRLSSPRENEREDRLANVLIDELVASPAEPFHLPLPTDKRLNRITRSLLDNPSLHITADDWCAHMGLSRRTLSRLFRQNVGMTFGTWRQMLHVQIALRELEQGVPVNIIAYDLGYESSSAFIKMFKRNTGLTPGTILSQDRD